VSGRPAHHSQPSQKPKVMHSTQPPARSLLQNRKSTGQTFPSWQFHRSPPPLRKVRADGSCTAADERSTGGSLGEFSLIRGPLRPPDQTMEDARDHARSHATVPPRCCKLRQCDITRWWINETIPAGITWLMDGFADHQTHSYVCIIARDNGLGD
jgi:hypothetical protein